MPGAALLVAGAPLSGWWVFRGWRAAGSHQIDVNLAVPALAAVAVTAAFTAMHLARPFGYASTWDSDVATTVGTSGAVVGLAPGDAAITQRNLATAQEIGLFPVCRCST